MSDTRTPTEQMRDIRNLASFIEDDSRDQLLQSAAVIMDQFLEAAELAYAGDRDRLFEVQARATVWKLSAAVILEKAKRKAPVKTMDEDTAREIAKKCRELDEKSVLRGPIGNALQVAQCVSLEAGLRSLVYQVRTEYDLMKRARTARTEMAGPRTSDG